MFLPENMQNELNTAIRAAIEAGSEITKIYTDPNADFEIEQKADNSPLTIADKKSNEIILSFLSQTPYPVLSEEGKSIDYSIRESWKKLWIVDPLDGTKEFIKRNGEFTVNIALVINGVPELGVIYVPVKRTLYYGLTGYGAYKIENIDAKPKNLSAENLRQFAIQLPIKREKRPFTVVASRSHLSPETASFIADLQQKHPDLVTTSIGSSIKICLVSEGNADIYPRFAPTMEWDTAAGHAIARAAGKEIYHTDRQTPISYNKDNLLNPWFIVE